MDVAHVAFALVFSQRRRPNAAVFFSEAQRPALKNKSAVVIHLVDVFLPSWALRQT